MTNYICEVKCLHSKQLRNNQLQIHWNMIYPKRCQNILQIVSKRKVIINDLTFLEMSSKDTDYYNIID